MAIKTILVPMQTEGAATDALEPALVLAEKLNAHVAAMHIRQRPTLAAPSGYEPLAVAYIRENSDEFVKEQNRHSEALKEEFLAACREHSVRVILPEEHAQNKAASASWRDEEGNLPYDFALSARVADLTVLQGSGEDASLTETGLAEELLFQSARPVLIIPNEGLRRFPDTVVVGWDGGLEAARAIIAALPILQLARKIIVLTVDKSKVAAPDAESAAAFLRMHDVNATFEEVSRVKEKAENVFYEAARDREADLLVIGAYSHNRWRETILGGFTRHMLRHADIPVLLAH